MGALICYYHLNPPPPSFPEFPHSPPPPPVPGFPHFPPFSPCFLSNLASQIFLAWNLLTPSIRMGGCEPNQLPWTEAHIQQIPTQVCYCDKRIHKDLSEEKCTK